MKGPASDATLKNRAAPATGLADVVALTGQFADRDQPTAEGCHAIVRAALRLGQLKPAPPTPVGNR